MTANEPEQIAFDNQSEYLKTYHVTDDDGVRLQYTVFAMDAWPLVAFAMHDGDTARDAYRIVRSMEGHLTVERLPAGLRRSGSSSADWARLQEADLSPQVEALRRHVSALPVEALLEWLRVAGRSRVKVEVDGLNRLHERAEVHAQRISLAERRIAALEIEDPDARAIAIQMADDWTGTHDELVHTAAGIAEPTSSVVDPTTGTGTST